jgi:hypothetical protein
MSDVFNILVAIITDGRWTVRMRALEQAEDWSFKQFEWIHGKTARHVDNSCSTTYAYNVELSHL